LSAHKKDAGRVALAVGALGVVFGDIGTSPLYSLQATFSRDVARPVPVTPDDVYGVISLVFWAITTIVTVQYVILIMRADNDGEGGIMALIALLLRLHAGRTPRSVMVLAALGIVGASLFFGDSIITPAISVLSAVEGLEIVEPSLEQLVVPISAAIIVGLFSVQRYGTGVVGRFFGPVMLVWFTVLAVAGVHGIADHPDVLKALSPTYAVQFFADRGLTAFLALGGIVLTVTGAEALYADMGHFGRGPIRRSWLLLVFPALVLNYMGQGALLIEHPSGALNPFFLLIPHWARLPMVFLATIATVIASQSVISGAFSVTRQAVSLGYLPRLRIRHTSSREGQIYVPFVNWTLLAAVLLLVFTFERSSKLASAYGIAVTGTITITTLLFFVVMHTRIDRGWVWAAAAVFLAIDLSFFLANIDKIVSGGWLPIAVAAIVCTVLFTWRRGRLIVTERREKLEGPLRGFIRQLHDHEQPVIRVPGTAVFLNRGDQTTPLAMRANVEFNHTLHEHVVVLSIETRPVPHVAEEQRLEISDLGFRDDGISHITAYFGFQDRQNVTEVLREAESKGLECPLEVEDAAYFLSKIELLPTGEPGMAMWRKHLFVATAHLAADPVEYFVLPRERAVLIGSHLEF
jgi:KUP system potassium uptake protein